MELTIVHVDDYAETIAVKRVFTIAGQFLYYELPADVHGYGKRIPMSDIKCWEINAVIQGSSQGLNF